MSRRRIAAQARKSGRSYERPIRHLQFRKLRTWSLATYTVSATFMGHGLRLLATLIMLALLLQARARK